MNNRADWFIEPFLHTRKLKPENQETPISFVGGDKTPAHLFYLRNHFDYPHLTVSAYFLPVNGLVKTPRIFSIQEIMSLPAKRLKMTLECSGDKRSLFKPKVFGEQWEKGAISQGYWKGVSLKTVLQYTGLSDQAVEVVVEGYDFGERKDLIQVVPYKRSLPLRKALHGDTLIAYEYNDQPIPFKHGFPFRLIVPGWYGMASVKWIKQITVVGKPFQGPFQTIDYVYFPNPKSDVGKFPVTTMNVNSTIQQPLNMDILQTGTHFIYGIAWTGEGKIKRVEVSFDNGLTWEGANIEQKPKHPYSWVWWTYEWNVYEKGEYTILSRAADSAGRTQPLQAVWNRKGYGYNAADKICVKVE
ncbi:sulfite oxidase [Bacillus songklensis]|uniref:Sulfite oxidase n=1 Tax=Bacillus songklensis TaxID=1069116 RepID=A0ABV8B6B9_9BACI